MAGQELKATDKVVLKMSKDGAVQKNLADDSVSRASKRTADAILKQERTPEQQFDKLKAAGLITSEHKKRVYTNLKFGRNNPDKADNDGDNQQSEQTVSAFIPPLGIKFKAKSVDKKQFGATALRQKRKQRINDKNTEVKAQKEAFEAGKTESIDSSDIPDVPTEKPSKLNDGKVRNTLQAHSSAAEKLTDDRTERGILNFEKDDISVGDMTPTLAMLCERDSTIGSFVKEKYFNVHLKSDGCDAVLEKVKEQSKAEKIKSDCADVQAVVKSVKREQKIINPPKLYDLTTLQREANRLYGFTAQQTLDYTQSLYESKIVTYPRTDSQFITEDMANTAKNIVAIVLKKLPHFDGIQLTPDIKRVINNKKVTDHTAIIPTSELANADFNAVPDGEKKILYLIANRLFCATSEKYVYETVTAEISCGGYSFVAKGKSVISDGWKGIEQKFRAFQKCKDDCDEEEAVLELSEGQIIEHPACDILENYTQPPKHFTEDTLLSAMERAGVGEITEEVERSGLGTPATRAGIIEKLTKSGFVEREKRNLVVTQGGAELVELMPDIIKSAKMTADWENSLSLIAQGKFTPQQFMADIEKLTSDIISVAKNSVDESKVGKSGGEVIGKCPRCGKNIVETPKAYSCEDRACGFALWKESKFFENAKKPFTKEMATALIRDSKVAVKGLYSPKTGKKYDATVCLDDTGKYVNFKLEFEKKH